MTGDYVARWWHNHSGRLVCELCPRACRLREGAFGFCFVRENRGGQMILNTYGRSTGFCIDPVEKKPLNHFLPGTSVLSFGTAGCNLGCKFCQAWEITKSHHVLNKLSQRASPATIAEAAVQLGCKSVAFTYNDPVIWAEYAIDTAIACRERGLKTIAVTAGYISAGAREQFFGKMDAANVDLKGFTEAFYQHYTLSHLQPVLDTLRWLRHESGVWVELTNLVIPDANDNPRDLQRMCRWIVEALGDDVPLHFTAFHPDFRMLDTPRTPRRTLVQAYEIARAEGVQFVYTGNVRDIPRQTTYCPACRRPLITRDQYDIYEYRLSQNQCSSCGQVIPGRFAARPGKWGTRRVPVDLSEAIGRVEAGKL